MVRISEYVLKLGSAGVALAAAAPAAAAPAGLPTQLSVPGMFMQADWIVKLVIIGLAIASIATWTIFIAKSLEIHRAASLQREMREQLRTARTLEAAQAQAELKSPFLNAAVSELRLSSDALHDADGIKERIATQFSPCTRSQTRSLHSTPAPRSTARSARARHEARAGPITLKQTP